MAGIARRLFVTCGTSAGVTAIERCRVDEASVMTPDAAWEVARVTVGCRWSRIAEKEEVSHGSGCVAGVAEGWILHVVTFGTGIFRWRQWLGVGGIGMTGRASDSR